MQSLLRQTRQWPDLARGGANTRQSIHEESKAFWKPPVHVDGAALQMCLSDNTGRWGKEIDKAILSGSLPSSSAWWPDLDADACPSVSFQKALGADWIVASGHKMCAPTGIGFLWGRADVLKAMPPWMGGGEMIVDVFLEGSTYAEPPLRFEAGTPAIGEAIALGAAIDYLQGIGMDKASPQTMSCRTTSR